MRRSPSPLRPPSPPLDAVAAAVRRPAAAAAHDARPADRFRRLDGQDLSRMLEAGARNPPNLTPTSRRCDSPSSRTDRSRGRRSSSIRRPTRRSKPQAKSVMQAVRAATRFSVPAQYRPFYEQWKTKTIHFDPESPLDERSTGEALSSSPTSPSMMLFFWFFGCPALVALAVSAARAARSQTGDVYVHAGANFKPVTIAVTPFAGERAATRSAASSANDFARSIFLLPSTRRAFPKRSPIRTRARTSTPGRRSTRNSC